MVPLVKRVQRHKPCCELDRPTVTAGRELGQHRLTQHGLGPAGVPSACHQQPRVEGRTGRELNVLKQHPVGRARVEDVDHDIHGEHELHGIPLHHRSGAESAAQLREVPAQRAERVCGIREQQLGELATGDGTLAQQ